jgi:hypothetical protein
MGACKTPAAQMVACHVAPLLQHLHLPDNFPRFSLLISILKFFLIIDFNFFIVTFGSLSIQLLICSFWTRLSFGFLGFFTLLSNPSIPDFSNVLIQNFNVVLAILKTSETLFIVE